MTVVAFKLQEKDNPFGTETSGYPQGKDNNPNHKKIQYFGHLMRRANSLEKALILGKIEDRRRRG